jgi:hypothetical protein
MVSPIVAPPDPGGMILTNLHLHYVKKFPYKFEQT